MDVFKRPRSTLTERLWHYRLTAMDNPDPVMAAIRQAVQRSTLSLEAIGVRMGYPKETARKSAWQFVNRTNDPRFSMVRRFAEAIDVPLSELVDFTTAEIDA